MEAPSQGLIRRPCSRAENKKIFLDTLIIAHAIHVNPQVVIGPNYVPVAGSRRRLAKADMEIISC